MAKRFTNSDKWKEKYFREFPTEYKLLWLYIWDDCDNAGIWDVDFETANFRLKVNVTEKEALELFSKEIKIVEDGDKWVIHRFIIFQYGDTLDPNVNAQKSVINKLRVYNLHDDYVYGSGLPY